MMIYAIKKSKIIAIFKTKSSMVAITTDTWIASNQKKEFMAIIAHFVDNNWDFQSLVMRYVTTHC